MSVIEGVGTALIAFVECIEEAPTGWAASLRAVQHHQRWTGDSYMA